MNYNSLIQQIQSYANRNEPAFIRIIPDIIDQAMRRIYSEAKSIGFQKRVEGTMVTNVPGIVKPVDYKSSINLEFTIDGPIPHTNFLLERSYEFCVLYSPNPLVSGVPVFYSADLDVPQVDVESSYFYISPTPNDNYAYTLTYLSFPPVFNATGGNDRNFLTDKYPNLLLYACMMEAIPYLKSDERIPVFESLYSRALDSVNKDTESRYSDRYSQRDKD